MVEGDSLYHVPDQKAGGEDIPIVELRGGKTLSISWSQMRSTDRAGEGIKSSRRPKRSRSLRRRSRLLKSTLVFQLLCRKFGSELDGFDELKRSQAMMERELAHKDEDLKAVVDDSRGASGQWLAIDAFAFRLCPWGRLPFVDSKQ
ncbi:uncharacterized protein A4U43_C04F21870 [Asparagus officinalis]|uniref:Uncharacterized protein n=1 Tax=Asparagus officinalis TaxID=4686 RepID=A0A5P1F7P1_ASPOF|nr:uncharacterized protein A4U43_C04F21870 [Asparagus officinalis]